MLFCPTLFPKHRQALPLVERKVAALLVHLKTIHCCPNVILRRNRRVRSTCHLRCQAADQLLTFGWLGSGRCRNTLVVGRGSWVREIDVGELKEAHMTIYRPRGESVFTIAAVTIVCRCHAQHIRRTIDDSIGGVCASPARNMMLLGKLSAIELDEGCC